MLTIIIPSINIDKQKDVYQSIQKSCSYNFKCIFVGTGCDEDILSLDNVSFIEDYGCPSRCFQRALCNVNTEYVTYTSDDCLSRSGSLDSCLREINDVLCLQYSESAGRKGSPHPIEYYRAGFHNDLRVENVDPNWVIPIIFMIKTELCKDYGGVDCAFEHINMNIHDLAFRMQRDGVKIDISSEVVWDADHIVRPHTHPVVEAHFKNDNPLFKKIYKNFKTRGSKIDLYNWKNSPEKWKRRFG